MNPFLCVTCGRRYSREGDCSRCAGSALLDSRLSNVQELMADADERRLHSREQKFLWLSVFVSMAAVLLLNGTDLFQEWRRERFALPFFTDQIALMAGLGYVLSKFLIRRFPPLRLVEPK
jgi:hypothetical protein